MSDAIITVEGLGKRYRLGASRSNERYTALRDVIAEKARSVFRNPRSAIRNRSEADASDFWALKDVSFEVKQGEVLGIIGRNGAGKSTLLKILSRITEPTEGRIKIKGRVASLLEVGTGFHPELTGRENIYLNGAILGMTRAEIKAKFDEIVAFAEVEKFLDTPVKRYSSGMYVRLAFAVAAHLEPEILIVDEVLAVGDAEFQRKCLGKMQQVATGRRTVIFVSHQLGQIRRLCSSAIWLDAGTRVASGHVSGVLAKYEATLSHRIGTVRKEPKYAIDLVSWDITQEGRVKQHIYDQNGPFEVRVNIDAHRELRHGHHTVGLYLGTDLLWGMEVQNFELARGSHQLVYAFPHLAIKAGVYEWRWSFHDERGLVDSFNSKPPLYVELPPAVKAGEEWQGLLNLPCVFSLESAENNAR